MFHERLLRIHRRLLRIHRYESTRTVGRTPTDICGTIGLKSGFAGRRTVSCLRSKPTESVLVRLSLRRRTQGLQLSSGMMWTRTRGDMDGVKAKKRHL